MSTSPVLRPILAWTLLALVSCGGGDDGGGPPDGLPADAPPSFPALPRIGTQIDRMGRPLIAAGLIGLRDTVAGDADLKRDAYNQAADPNKWASTEVAAGRTVTAELMANLPLFDVFDRQNPAIQPTPPLGCQNQLFYNGGPPPGGNPDPNSYRFLAELFADDMIYLDTKLETCTRYLPLEIEYTSATLIMHSDCGGRAPTHDAVDALYSALIAGVAGFTSQPVVLPKIADGVPPHADLTATFPYFGPPH